MKKSVKRILAGLLSLCMAISSWSPALTAEAALTQKTSVNVAQEATASSAQTAIEGFEIVNVNDGSEDTSWKTNAKAATAILAFTPSKENVSKVVVKLGSGENASGSVNVKVQYAKNGIQTELVDFGTEQTVALTGNMTGEFTVANAISPSHVYVTLTNPSGENVDLIIKEIEVYDEVTETLSNYDNIAWQADVESSGTPDTIADGVEDHLTDGDDSTLYKFHKPQWTAQTEVTVSLTYEQPRKMDAFRIAFEHVNSTSDSAQFKYNYSIKAKNADGEYDVIASNVTADRVANWQQYYAFGEAAYSEVLIIMHSCTANNAQGYGWAAIAEFDVYGEEAEVTDNTNIALRKPVHTSSGEGTAQKITDGSTNSTWRGDYYPAYVDIDLQANYKLNAVEVYTPENGYSQYSIYTSINGRNFDKLAEKTSKNPATLENGEVYAAKDKEARIVRVYMEYNSAETAAVLNEVKVFGTPSGTPVQQRPEIAVVDFDQSAYANTTVTAEDTRNEVYGIIGRRLGEDYKSWFTLELAASSDGYDYFELSTVNGKVHVKGNDGVSLATGINHYLKYFCNVNISQVGDQVDMPATAPVIDGTVHKETKAKVRYSYNYCTLSYSMAFWGEPEWRNELDWLALNGVNVVLDATAQEEVWRRFLGKLGYTHEEAKDYIAGPAYYAWAYMANLSGFGGPVHDSWFEERTELARKNQKIMRNLGMQPVLQGYSGMVPIDITSKATGSYALTSSDIIGQGNWCYFQRPSMLRTTSAAFDKYAELFYACQKEVYGDTSDYYATDPFHEGGNKGGMNASDISREVLTSMLAADENAIWIIQAWQGNPTTALLNGLDQVTNGAQHALVLDLYAEKTPHHDEKNTWEGNDYAYGDTEEFDDTPWLYCMLNNFGGRLGLHGHLDNMAREIPNVFNNRDYIAGIGITPEASVNNPVLYDFLFETVWQDDASQPLQEIALGIWLHDYAERRYGAESKSANAAWDILKETVYKGSLNNRGQGAPESVVNARPALNIGAASTWGNAVVGYDKVELEKAAKFLLEDYDTLDGSKGYMYDLANILQQVLSNSAQEYQKKMTAAFNAKNLADFEKYSKTFLEIIGYMETVTATSEYFLLGRWVEQAKALGKNADDFTKDLYEFNAKALVTTWGAYKQAEGGGLKDYSNRQWSGLIGDFYKPRWERWITARTNELKEQSYETSINWFQWEWEWARSNTVYTTKATPADLETLGYEILEKFTSANPAANASRDVDPETMTVYAENYHDINHATEGNPDYVIDGNPETIWHTQWYDTARDTQYLEFTFDEVTEIDGIRFLQRSGVNGVVTKFDLLVKESENAEWKTVIDDGVLATDAAWQLISFDKVMAKKVKFQVVEANSDSTSKYGAAAEIRFTEPQLWVSEVDKTERVKNIELKASGQSIVQINGVTANEIKQIDVENASLATVKVYQEPAVSLLTADAEAVAEEAAKSAKLLVTAGTLPEGTTSAKTSVTVTSTSNESTSFTVTVTDGVVRVELNVGERYDVKGKVSGTPTNSSIVNVSDEVEDLSELDAGGEYMIVPARATDKAIATDLASSGYVVKPSDAASANRKFYWKITKTDSGYTIQPAEDLTKYIVVDGNALTDTPTSLRIEKHVSENQIGFAIGCNGSKSWNLVGGAGGNSIGPYSLDLGNIWYLYKNNITTITGLTPGVTEVTIGGVKHEFTVVAEEEEITLNVGERKEVSGTINVEPKDIDIATAFTKVESIDELNKVGGGEYMIVPARAPFKAIVPNAAGDGIEVLDAETHKESRGVYWKITKTDAGYTIQPSNNLNKYVNAAGNALVDEEAPVSIIGNFTAGGYTGFLLGGSAADRSWNLNGGALGTSIIEHHKNDGGNIWYLYQKNTTITGVKPGKTEAIIGGVKYTINVIDKREITINVGQSKIVDGQVDVAVTNPSVADTAFVKVEDLTELDNGGEYLIVPVMKTSIVVGKNYTEGATSLPRIDITSAERSNSYWTITKNEDGTYCIQDSSNTTKYMNLSSSNSDLRLTESKQGLTIVGGQSGGYTGFFIKAGNYKLNLYQGPNGNIVKGDTASDHASLWYLYKKQTVVTGVRPGVTEATIGGVKYVINVIEEKDVTVKAGETISLLGDGGTVIAEELAKIDASIANVATGTTTVKEYPLLLHSGGYAGKYEDSSKGETLGDCFYTFEKSSAGDKAYYVYSVTDNGERAYLRVKQNSNVGFPSSSDKDDVIVTTNNGKFSFTNTYSDNQEYPLRFICDWHVFNETTGDATPITEFELREVSVDENGTSYSYQPVKEIQDGGKYVIVVVCDHGEFVLRPDIGVTDAERNDHVAKLGAETIENATEVQFTGVSAGNTSVMVGTTKYNVHVLGEKDITVKVGESVRIFDQSGTYNVSGRDTLDTTIADVTVVPQIINDKEIQLFNEKTALLSECIYTFNKNADGTYQIVARLADGTNVYLNPYKGPTQPERGFPNTKDAESITIEKTEEGFVFKDPSIRPASAGNGTTGNYCLSFVKGWKVFNENYWLDGGWQNTTLVSAFKLYELKKTGDVYTYTEVTDIANIEDGGQYVIVAAFEDGGSDVEYVLHPSSDSSNRNAHVAKLKNLVANATTTEVNGNAMTVTGVSKGRTKITVGNTTYNIFVIQDERYIELVEEESIVLYGKNLTSTPDTGIVTTPISVTGGYSITALKPGNTEIILDGVIYHITVLEKEIGSEIGTSSGQKVTRLKMTADRTFDLNVINTNLTNIEWLVTDLDGNPVTWAEIDKDTGEVRATEDGKTITSGQDGYIVAKVYDENGAFVKEIKIEFRLNPQPANLDNVRLYDIYIDDLHHTEVYYGWIYANNGKYEYSPKLSQAIEGEVLYISMDKGTNNALDFFAKPEDGYALTRMGATGTWGHYARLEGDSAAETEFLTATDKDGKNFAGKVQYGFAPDATVGLVGLAMQEGCHGAQGFTRTGEDGMGTILSYRSEQLPTVKKDVIGVWDRTDGYQPYTKDMKIQIGDYVFFSVTVDKYACEDLITYSNVELTEMLAGATFIQEVPRASINPTTLTGKESIGITEDINGDKWIEGAHTYYAMYQIQPEDVADALHTVKNTVALSYNYQSHYSKSTFDGTATGEASVVIENLPLKSMVVDFGLPVTYTFNDAGEYNEITEAVETLYGEVTITRVPSGAVYTYTVNYTPTDVLKGADIIKFVPTDSSKETKVVMVYPATTVHYEEGFAAYTGSWETTGSKGAGSQAHRYLEIMENMDNYGYDGKYANELSGPSNKTAAISKQAGNMASFEFTGTGTDIYANCTPESGNVTILVRAKNADGTDGAIKKMLMVNTKMKAGGTSTAGQEVTAYGMCIASITGLEHGTYSVKIQHGTTLVEQNKKDTDGNDIINPETNQPEKVKVPVSKEISLDGFRVYNAFKDSDIFRVHYEAHPNFIEMRNVVLNSLSLTDILKVDGAEETKSIYADDIADNMTQVLDPNEKVGAMIVSAASDYYTAANVKDLLDNGPKNEIFLYEGQALTFTLEAGVYNAQIGMRAVNSATEVHVNTAGVEDVKTLTSSTDMFYKLGDMNANTTIVIRNADDGNPETKNILSVTDLKCFTSEQEIMPIDVFAPISEDTFMLLLVSMGYAEKPKETKPVTEIFTDVEDTWYTEFVQYVYDNGLMNGIGGTTEFQPNRNITRAQIVQVLYNMEKQPEALNRDVFTDLKDVAEDAWYADAVAWAYSAGVVSGNSSTKMFSPNNNATREQLSMIMYQYAHYKGYKTDQTSDLEGMLNKDAVSDWSAESVRWAVGAGIISGVDKNGVKDLAPKANATRAQMAVILKNFSETYK